MRLLRLALALVTLASLAGCADDEPPPPPPPPTTAAAGPTTTEPTGPPPPLKLTTVATVDRPTAMAQRTGDDTIYVAEKGGRVRAVSSGGVLDPAPVLDLSREISDDGERGLLGLAFAPQGNAFYVDFTDRAGDTHVVEFTLDGDGRADIGTRRELLFVKQPYPNHNGGQLVFGPDKKLYIALGDGGSANDPQKNGQNLSVLLGKILRIDPAPSNGLPYTIPFDNPFAERSGARGEIWAYGLRNPWRFTFDKADGSTWIADVGQGRREEIDHVAGRDPRGGQNYGWSLREGTLRQDGERPRDAVEPVHEYGHNGGACSVTGGYVYRGQAIPGLTGRYLFADFCSAQFWTLTRRGTDWEDDELAVKLPSANSFGQDHKGELYVLSMEGQVSRLDPA